MLTVPELCLKIPEAPALQAFCLLSFLLCSPELGTLFITGFSPLPGVWSLSLVQGNPQLGHSWATSPPLESKGRGPELRLRDQVREQCQEVSKLGETTRWAEPIRRSFLIGLICSVQELLE